MVITDNADSYFFTFSFFRSDAIDFPNDEHIQSEKWKK